MRVTLKLALVPVLLAATSLANAAAPRDVVFSDMKCIIVAGNIPEGTSAEDENALMTTALFFAGKVYGRNPTFDMKTYLTAYGDEFDDLDRAVELNRCATELGKRGAEMEAAGE